MYQGAGMRSGLVQAKQWQNWNQMCDLIKCSGFVQPCLGRARRLFRVLCPLQVPPEQPVPQRSLCLPGSGENRTELVRDHKTQFIFFKVLLGCFWVPFLMYEILKLCVKVAFICAFFPGY